ncbi:ATP-binding protein [Methanobrevibacter sp. DSM 116169]|uniref:ATP-binding protein n=1 Tax=Methanobrevibacter sp. DSM 116169 TaxID=3242727 RepID=UPI0038FC23D3
MVKRELYMKKIRPLIDKDIIKVITGIRRCGKSFMLNLIIDELIQNNINKNNIVLINLESNKYSNIEDNKDLNKLIYKLTENIEGKIYLFFDEIQNIENWEKSINGFRVDLNCDIYITGSNSELLSGELSSLLTGRFMEIEMYPFSYKEALLLEKDLRKNTNEKEIFDDYLKYGGMPFIFQLNNDEKIKYLNDILNSIIYKDIIKRNEIRDVDLFDKLIKYIISNIGHTFSARRISKYFKNESRTVSSETIYNYLLYCVNAFLLFKVQRKDLQGKKILKISEKYYLSDHGFNQVSYNGDNNIAQILENIVYLEFKRRDYDVYIGKINGLEVDFVCEKKGSRIYVQVSYILANEDIIKREFKPLSKIKDNYPKYVLSLDEYDFSKDGITHLNIREFLKSDI